MIYLRKFFDPAVAEPVADVSIERPSIASLMAKHGVTNDTENPVATPIEITPSVKEPEPTATVPADSNADSTTTAKETPLPTEEPKREEAQKEQPPLKAPTWQEVLKSEQPDTILKELGFDDKAIRLARKLNGFQKADFFENLINAWETNGDLKGYLKELSTDYQKMPAEEVMRHQLRSEYPKASDKALEVLFRKEVVERYNLDSSDEAEQEEGRLLLEAKADRHRDELVKNQQSYLFPPPPEAKPSEPDKREQEAAQEAERYRSQVVENSYLKDIKHNGKMTIGEGDEKMFFPVNSDELVDLLLNDDKWQETQFNIERNPDKSIKSYSPKVEHQILTAAVAKYGMNFINALAQHFKTIGAKSVADPIENAKPSDNSTPANPQIAPKTAAEAMARGGVLNSGGYNR